MDKPIEIMALIPARGGSKSIPQKNITDLMGHPLIAYSITSALAAKMIHRVIVSTDDQHIAEIARQYGAEVPFLRPGELARDNTSDFPVIEHAIRWLKSQENYSPDIVVQLRPTSPLRPKNLIDEGVRVFTESRDVDCVRAVVQSEESPFKMWVIDSNGFIKALLEGWFYEPYNMPRQELPKTYWQTGHLDVIGTETIKNKKSLTGTKILPILVDKKYCIDIDKLEDLREAGKLLSSGLVDIEWPVDKKSLGKNSNDYREVLPGEIKLIVLDFDGVLTDNKVFVLEDGSEGVVCNRSDGLAINMLREANFKIVVLTQEVNPVVEKRCQKIGLKCYSEKGSKAKQLAKISKESHIPLDNCIYVGDDVNDLECMRMVGCSVAVADAAEEIKNISKIVLQTKGGHGAVRELADLLLNKAKIVRN